MDVAFVTAHANRATIEIVVTEDVYDRVGENQVEHQGTRLGNPEIF